MILTVYSTKTCSTQLKHVFSCDYPHLVKCSYVIMSLHITFSCQLPAKFQLFHTKSSRVHFRKRAIYAHSLYNCTRFLKFSVLLFSFLFIVLQSVDICNRVLKSFIMITVNVCLRLTQSSVSNTIQAMIALPLIHAFHFIYGALLH